MSQVLSPRRRKVSWELWMRLLAGPIIWATHSVLGYLFVEAFCQTGLNFNVLGMKGLSFILVMITLTAVVWASYLGLQFYRDWRYMRPGKSLRERLKQTKVWSDETVEFIFFTGFLLSILFTINILMVALPALFLRTCI